MENAISRLAFAVSAEALLCFVVLKEDVRRVGGCPAQVLNSRTIGIYR